MPAFYRASLGEFVTVSDSELVGLLSLAYAREGFQHQRTDQTLAWSADLPRLRRAFAEVLDTDPRATRWKVLLEFEIPRKMRRIDVVVLAGDHILLLELKAHRPTSEDLLQAEEYALLLHYFHEPSRNRHIVSLAVSGLAAAASARRQEELPFVETAAFWIAPVQAVTWAGLARAMTAVTVSYEAGLDGDVWEAGAYRPVPTIIQAALSLQSGLDIREIAHSGAARHDVDQLTALIQARVAEARSLRQHVICFVTGVPVIVDLTDRFNQPSSNLVPLLAW